MAAVLVGFLLVCLLGLGQARYNQISDTYHINNLITCRGGIAERGVVQRPPGEAWLPDNRSYTLPRHTVRDFDPTGLYGHLGVDHNRLHSQVNRPDTDPTLPLTNTRFTPTITGRGLLPDSTYSATQQAGIIRWTNNTIGCRMTAEWTQLDNVFWPRWLAARRCLPMNSELGCSLPAGGQVCDPVYRGTEFATILAWDCCEVGCGWRKVRFQLPTACMCACRTRT